MLFFDDYPYDSENRLFRLNLRRKLKGQSIELIEEKTVRGFERVVRTGRADILVLDIMASSPEPLMRCDTGQPVPETMTGVELLRRCRRGIYSDKYTTAPIYMRTARGEADIRHYCESLGVTGYFKAGADDITLIDVIAAYIADNSSKE